MSCFPWTKKLRYVYQMPLLKSLCSVTPHPPDMFQLGSNFTYIRMKTKLFISRYSKDLYFKIVHGYDDLESVF